MIGRKLKVTFFTIFMISAIQGFELDCPEDENFLLPHFTSCRKYYECDNGVWFEHICEEDQQFNPTTLECDLSEHVNCIGMEEEGESIEEDESVEEDESLEEDPQFNDFDCPPEGSHSLSHPTSCEKFIRCVDGVGTVNDCFPGFHWSVQESKCKIPEEANCEIQTEAGSEETDLPSDEEENETENSTDGPIEELTTELSSVETEDPLTGEPEEEQEQPNGECDPINGEYVQFLTDKSNCDRFYKCDWGTPILTFCPDGLHFNPTLNVCDWPWDAGCTAESTETTDDTEPSTDETDSPITETESSITETESSITETESSITETESSITETESSITETDTPIAGTESTTEAETATDPETETNPPETEAPQTENPEEQQNPNGECDAMNGEYVQFLTDKYHCDRFYKCNWGTPILMFCPDGLHFNPTLNVCDWPWDAGCTAQSSTEGLPSTDAGETTTIENELSTVEAETENTETETPSPETEAPITEAETTTSGTETATDAETQTNAPETEAPITEAETTTSETETATDAVTETSAPETEEPQTENPEEGQQNPDGECDAINGEYVQFLTDKNHCDRFYKCNWGTPILMFCPDGLHFNPTLNVCDWPWDAGCTAQSPTEGQSSSTDAAETTTAENNTENPTIETDAPVTETEAPVTETEAPVTETEAPVTETEAPVTETEAPVTETEAPVTETEAPVTETEAPVTEPQDGPNGTCNSNGQYLTDKLHCDRFYQCSLSTPVLLYCPAGLHFNPAINVCDWPANAGCKTS